VYLAAFSFDIFFNPFLLYIFIDSNEHVGLG